MNLENLYVIDTSSLVNLARWNPPDIYIRVWQEVDRLIREGRLTSPREVLNELAVGNDSLAKWGAKRGRMFKKLTVPQAALVSKIVREHPGLVDSDKETPVADPFVIALALEKSPQPTLVELGRPRIVVCDEALKGNQVRIPYVCQSYNLSCITGIGMFRAEGWKF